MSNPARLRPQSFLFLALFLSSLSAHAQQIKKVFVIAFENHNWTQPVNAPSSPAQQIFQNPNAPFLNRLVRGEVKDISPQLAYCTAYHNVLATPTGNNPHIHPSEPSYIWSEAGNNLGVLNDNDPYSGHTNQATTEHLSALLTKSGKTWRSYQEDIDLASESGHLINTPAPRNRWTVPLTSFAGIFAKGTNAYNGSKQFNYATKHNPMIFFSDTNGGNDATPNNPMASHYAPVQQLADDLNNNTVADYNWITPDQFNDMHTTLAGGFKGLTGDAARVRQGDEFLRQLLPMIMASKAYQDNGLIILWWDESEPDTPSGANSDDFKHTIPEIIISPLAHKNIDGHPYASSVNYTHSSDLRTMQEIFHLGPWIRDAANASDLSDLFQPGVVPKNP